MNLVDKGRRVESSVTKMEILDDQPPLGVLQEN